MSKQVYLIILTLTYFLILKRRELALFSLMERLLIRCCKLRFVSIFMPRYLTLSVGHSLLPHRLIFKSLSNFFCLDLKITISVFFTLSEILFACNQLTKCFKLVLTSLYSFLKELLGHKRLVSSAKCWSFQNVIVWLRRFIYTKNRRDPRTDPRGMPQFCRTMTKSGMSKFGKILFYILKLFLRVWGSGFTLLYFIFII